MTTETTTPLPRFARTRGSVLEELEHILFLEVDPILSLNLSPVGMIWTGFDQEWLRERIQARPNSVVLVHWPLQRWVRSRLYPWRELESGFGSGGRRRVAESIPRRWATDSKGVGT